MAWRLAHSLEKLREQVNETWPDRSKDSDGSIGDEHHSARSSDHNPDESGVVRAIDITHDPKNGFDSYAFATRLLKKQDPRLKYVISNKRIGSGPAGPFPGAWRKYSGINPHDHHCHISVVPDARGDATGDWDIGEMRAPNATMVESYGAPPQTIRKGAKGDDVKRLQEKLHLVADGSFGPLTEKALKDFQAEHSLPADGICGPLSWSALA